MKKYIEKIIQSVLDQYIEATKKEKVSLPFEVMSDIELTELEKQTLTKLGNDKILSTIYDKFLFGLSARALNSHTESEISELRGAVKTIQFMQGELSRYKTTTKVNRVTGEIIQ